MGRYARITLLAAALLLGGCGGPIQPEQLRRGVETISSLAGEGALLADGVAGDRTRATFTRVQARTVADLAQHEAEKLADADADAGLRARKARAVALAQGVNDALGELEVRPGDESVGRAQARTLRRLQASADRLVDAL